MSMQQWFYRDGRPNRLARVIDRLTAAIYARGVKPDYLVTLEVRGRRTGRSIRFPLVMVERDGERYLVSMLGERANWVRNVREGDGRGVLHHGRREVIRLEEVPVERRAPVLAAYLKRAPNARVHLALPDDAPMAAIEPVAASFPVFRVVSQWSSAER